MSLDGSTTDEGSIMKESSRDEEVEIRKESQKETSRVKTWRILVLCALLATAVSVTATTYTLLVKQEDTNFKNVYAQFARTVANAAIGQQQDLQDALGSLSDTISLSAELLVKSSGGEPAWPYFYPPMFETYAQDFKKISKAEFVGVTNLVLPDERDAYINYANSVYEDAITDAHLMRYGNLDLLDMNTSKYVPDINKKNPAGKFVPDDERDMYFVRLIQSPPMQSYGAPLNWNLASFPPFRGNFDAVLALQNETVLGMLQPFIGLPDNEHQGFHSDENEDNPHLFAQHPIYEYGGNPKSKIVAIATTAIAFDASMLNLLPENVKGMLCVIENTCNQTMSYIIEGERALFQGYEDQRDPKYKDMGVGVNLALYSNADTATTPGHCMYSMTIYPTQQFEDDYKTNTPAVFAGIVAGTFLFVALVFFVYDRMVIKRNELVISNAVKSNAIVSSVVPDHLRARLLANQKDNGNRKSGGNLKKFLNDGTNVAGGMSDSTPLADLFLETTICFADISGFTAWSSVREPTQVFVLLETLYGAFDSIAKRRRVFKVETVGDCYVAVCGLPEPRKDHAVGIARFARDIVAKMRILTRELEVTLGPDTGDLSLRVGVHSGPVTAGVLRGERARFQLFGDTMNTCARLESSSQPNRIQCSKETAEQLLKFGKGGWVAKRTEPMPFLKGKGQVEGYWLNIESDKAGSVASGYSSVRDNSPVTAGLANFPELDDRTVRLIDWNVEMLLKLMKAMAAQRAMSAGARRKSTRRKSSDNIDTELGSTMPLEEVREIITLPEFDVKASQKQMDPAQMEIPDKVVQQLHHLVSSIAGLYNDNPFHNFDHASHVVMSVIKLMGRIVAPSHLMDSEEAAASLHDHTYGITSDPLTQFACAFSALIHDVDHVGVSNAQLVNEGASIAAKYQDRSVAEQNSLDLSWDLLMIPDYHDLRSFLFSTPGDRDRFRQLVVNSVMATDIVDKDLKDLRNSRWTRAFKNGDCATSARTSSRDSVNRKATIVIEHIIQASDISHTMQHWHVYRKWNQALFEELYVAYLNGRMEKDPATFWYKGEFGFFDFYIIPLTQKLKDCGVFGVSSDEYLNYAVKNRAEWEAKGEEVVAKMVKEVHAKYGVKGEGSSSTQMPKQAPSGVMEQAPIKVPIKVQFADRLPPTVVEC